VGVRGRFATKADLERVFYQRLLERFDADKDGKLEREELLMGLTAMSGGDLQKGFNLDDAGINSLFERLDADGSGALEETELLRYLRSAEFQSSRVAATIMAYVLDGQLGVEEMMTGFRRPHLESMGPVEGITRDGKVMVGSQTLDVENELYGLERSSGMIVKEHIPGYVKMALQMLYKAGDLAKLGAVRSALSAFSAHEGAEKDSHESAETIQDFRVCHIQRILLPPSQAWCKTHRQPRR